MIQSKYSCQRALKEFDYQRTGWNLSIPLGHRLRYSHLSKGADVDWYIQGRRYCADKGF